MLRCYQCGRSMTEDEAVRRNVTTSRFSYGSYFELHGRGHAKGRVDLCPQCNAIAEESERTNWVAVLVGFGILIIGVGTIMARMP
jgi:hypothetical protein